MIRQVVVIGMLLIAASSAFGEPFKKTITDVSSNTNTADWRIASSQVTPDAAAPWSIRKLTLRGGKQGVELLIVDNGKLTITLIPTRGMGVLDVKAGDLRIGWESPVKEVVHPAFVDQQSRGGLGWLAGFNEFMCRCGLESNGHPGMDKFINNVGDEATMELTLHGRNANLPAQKVAVEVDTKPPHRIAVRGRVDEKMLYGPKLELHTELSTEPGSSSFRIADTIVNVGGSEQEFQILYHVNFGRPLLEAGAKFVAPAKQVTPFNDFAAKTVQTYADYSGPTPGFMKKVYCMRLFGDDNGQTKVMLQNKSGDRAVSMGFSLKELPYLTQWKNTTAEADGYVTGIEPGTNFPHNRRVERQFGRVPKLAAGGKFHAAINYELHVGSDSVAKVADEIGKLQAQQATVIDRAPEKPKEK